ncbi:hypothetical protein FACS189461_1560 [Spirochaetia bacterium]|nr:hypothetical protein FACS189461_1560 [Spirochaetia bacterium]
MIARANHYWRTPDANMERGNRSYENMKMRLEAGKPLNLNDQLNAISKGLIPSPRAFDCTNAMPKEVGSTGKTIKSSSGRNGGISLNAYAKLFPTPRANSGKSPCVHGQGSLDLQTAVKLWPTPTVNGNNNEKGSSPKSGDGLATAAKKYSRLEYNTIPLFEMEINENGELKVEWAVEEKEEKRELWPTPRAGNPSSRPNGKGGKVLSEEVKKSLIPTPTKQDFKHRGPNSQQQGLADVVRLWATPTANDAKNSLTESQRGRGTLTAHVVENMYPTPTTPRPHDSENTAGKYMPGQKQKDLTYEVAREGGQLNPDWVEALMGYPLGWTDITKGTITDIDYLEAWLNGTWENGLPPVIAGIMNRVKRLKCLGNAVVPEIPAIIIQMIVRAL